MSDIIKFLKEFLIKLPSWAKIVISILTSIIVALLVFTSLIACGSTTRAVIKKPSDTSSVTVSITTNNPSEITVNPEASVKIDSSRFKKSK